MGNFLTEFDSRNPTNKNPEQKSGLSSVKKDNGLLRSSGIVSFFTMLSRLMGLARDIVFARVIGADAFADVFFVAKW